MLPVSHAHAHIYKSTHLQTHLGIKFDFTYMHAFVEEKAVINIALDAE